MKKVFWLFSALGLTACAEKSSAPLPTVSTMTMVTRLEYPTNAKTVADAAQYILRPTGYRLVTQCPNCPPEAQVIADKPISPLALTPQITTVSRALILIGGSRTGLLVDPDHKVISYTWAQPGLTYLSQGGASNTSPVTPPGPLSGQQLGNYESSSKGHSVREVPVSETWVLVEGRPIGEQLVSWGDRGGWRVLWPEKLDWTVPALTRFSGDFQSAVSSVLQAAAHQGMALKAEFHVSNHVLVISQKG